MAPSPSVAVVIDADEGRPPPRLLSPRAIIPTGVAGVIVIVGVVRANINWGQAWSHIRHADVALYLAALVVFYISFGVRGVRWSVLLENAGAPRPARGLVGIIITSFFVNCVVPAKMGDVYRAYLLRGKQGVSGTKAFGTIIAERLMDLCILMVLLLAAGAVSFGKRVPHGLVPYAVAGTLLCVLGVTAVIILGTEPGARILRRTPEAIFARYESFRTGTVHALRRWPLTGLLTVTIWGLEAGRLGLVVLSLGYGAFLGPAQVLLVALVAALLTTVPFLPGGLGLVEGGMIFVLVTVVGVERSAALTIALLDRSISYGSLVILGFVVAAFTHLQRPHHHRRDQALAKPLP